MKPFSHLALSFAAFCLLTACSSSEPAAPTAAATEGSGAQANTAPNTPPCPLPEPQADAPAQANAPTEAPAQAAVPVITSPAAHAAPGAHGAQVELPANLTPGQVGHFGAPFTLASAPLSLNQALEMCANTGATCKIAATIDRVCQSKGCWFTLAAPDVDRPIRVRMKDYAFFVPRNAMGASVIVEGVLSAAQESQELAQHYAQDEAANSGQPAQVVTGPQLTYSLLVSSVEVTQAGTP